ncbi:MAG: hypothetical protein AAF741_00805 [Bacteroidota bacterium]
MALKAKCGQVAYGEGVRRVNYSSLEINIYDREKTVCDFVRLRSKVEHATLKEVLNHYLSDQNKNLERLKAYSKALRVEKYLDRYLSLAL